MGANYWQQGYIYVTDEAGDEIAGSRRNLSAGTTMDAYRELWLMLQAQAGEGCRVKHSEAG